MAGFMIGNPLVASRPSRFAFVPVSYPAEDTLVSAIGKKTLEQVMICVPNPSATQ
jgi:hypothetical protein